MRRARGVRRRRVAYPPDGAALGSAPRSMSDVRIQALGDCALLLSFGERIDPALNRIALAAAEALCAADLPGVRDVAPAYASICIRYDPLAWVDPSSAHSPHARIASRISAI